MNRTVILIITILAVVPLIKSEIPEHDHSTMMMGQSDNNNQDGELLGVGKNSFWLKEQNFTLWFHIIIMMVSLGTLIPIGIVLGLANVKSRWYINVQIVGILISVIGFFFGNPSKSLYPMNFHSKFGWIILFVLLLQAVFGFIRFTFDERNHKFRFVKLNIDDSRDENYSASSHEVKSSVHDSLLYNSNDSSQTEYEREDFPSPRQNNFSSKIRSIASKKIFKIIHNIIGYTLIILIYSQFILGFITLSDTCHGESFGNCLAHYSKGSIFLWFGLVAFARYLGFFEKFGWEWNVLPISSSDDFNNEKNQKGKVSFSFLESVIVFLYGITNTFLEHTGKDPWNHRDIQHATLAFMWWWAGLLGIILESKRIRKILFSNSSTSIENPIPSIIFIVTAISISTHHQTNEFSLTIHKQFGGFLLLAGLFRLITIMVLHNNNNVISNTNYNSNDLKNSIIHPPTEFIASFCFVACGITLMIANKSIIFLFSNIYNFDTNFILNFVIASSFFTLSFVTFLLFIYKYSLPYKK